MIDLIQLFPRRPDLAALGAQGPAALVARVLVLEERICTRAADLAAARSCRPPIGDSRTTPAPPSSDPRPKPRSARCKSERKSGGQPGHDGHRLQPVARPDQTVTHRVERCRGCGADLRTAPVAAEAAHQVFDLPLQPLEVTEHRLETKVWAGCGIHTRATPPPGAEQPTPYGPRLAAFAVYLTSGHFLPLQRTCDLIEKLTAHRVSEGWVKSCHARLASRLEPFIAAVTAALRAAKVVCCDETGFRFAARRFWLHVCCTATLTLLLCPRRRGVEGIAAVNVLTSHAGVAMHDHWPSYFTFTGCLHAVCHEHHIRELTAVEESDRASGRQAWAAEMKLILYAMLELKRSHHDQGRAIPAAAIAALTARYQAGLNAGYAVTPAPPCPTAPKRGRPARGKTLALLDRLRDRQEAALRCLHDPHVPWSNNQAERDIRPMKIQQKVSGGFRTEHGAVDFCRIRSYLSTLDKNGVDLFEGIALALAGTPWLPPFAANVSAAVTEDQQKSAA